MAQSLLIQASLGVAGAVWDPETVEAANDYTDDTMRRVAELLLGASVGEIQYAGNVRRCTISKTGELDREITWTDKSFPVLTPLPVRAAA
jgi:hypothetical protein